MADFDQSGEELDENLPPDYPPDRPAGVYDEEATGVPAPSSEGDEWGDADDATLPEAWEGGEASAPGPSPAGPGAPVLEGDEDVGAVDEEKDLVAPPPATGPAERGPLASDDEFSGDETTRDVATERVPRPSEEDAVRYDEEPPGATG